MGSRRAPEPPTERPAELKTLACPPRLELDEPMTGGNDDGLVARAGSSLAVDGLYVGFDCIG